jgi:hypothetical protein
MKRSTLWAAGADVLAVVAFVLIGRSSHHEDAGAAAAVGVMLPFLVGLILAWIVTRAWRGPLPAFPTGATIWVVTAAAGLLLRRFAWQRSTALAFVIVGSVFLLLALVGWRLLAEWVRERRTG